MWVSGRCIIQWYQLGSPDFQSRISGWQGSSKRQKGPGQSLIPELRFPSEAKSLGKIRQLCRNPRWKGPVKMIRRLGMAQAKHPSDTAKSGWLPAVSGMALHSCLSFAWIIIHFGCIQPKDTDKGPFFEYSATSDTSDSWLCFVERILKMSAWFVVKFQLEKQLSHCR